MLVWFEQSLKKLHERQRQQEKAKAEVSELQDAMIELAGLVSGFIDNNINNIEGDSDG